LKPIWNEGEHEKEREEKRREREIGLERIGTYL
jgi:hypothetical protein